MFVNFNILNQLGSPAINSNTFANRPAAGQTGRLFVSTDTFEIYRDNGTTWDLIGGPGSSTITGTGTATQVAYFTSSQAIGSSANLFWDNTSGFLGVATATPSARIEAVKTDGVGIYANFTTNAGSGSSTTALWAKNVTNSSGFAAVIEETTPNTTAGQYPLLIKHSLSSGTAGVGMGTGIHWQLPDDAGTFKTTQLTIETINAAAATYATRYRFNVQNNGSSTPVAYINATGLGIFTATPGAALDIHSTGIMAQLNTTSATGNTYIAFQRTGSGLWRIGDTYNGGNNFFELHNTVLAVDALEFEAATNKSAFQAQQTYTTGLARGNYFDYNLSVAAGGSFSSPNAITALTATLDLTLAGNATIPSGARSGLDAYNTIAFTGAGTLTHNQGTQIRAYSNVTAGWAFAGSAVGTITHLAGLRALFPDNSGSAVNVTNNYALLLNDQTANTGTVTYTNRWGIYQEGTSDLNYFAANTLIGTTTNSGQKLQVNGSAILIGTATSSVTLGFGTQSGSAGWSIGNGIIDNTHNFRIYDNTAGANRITLDGNGYFLIGLNTSSSDPANLQVNGVTPANDYNSQIQIRSSTQNAGDKARLAFFHSTHGSSFIQSVYESTSYAYLSFATRGGGTIAERMRINSSGAVQIAGTATPAGTLDVNGSIVTTNGAGTTYNQFVNAGNDVIWENRQNGNIIIRSNSSTERARFSTAGNFIIGTTTDAGQKLQVNGNGLFTRSSGVTLEATQTAATNSHTALIRQTGAGGNGNQDIGLIVDIQGANDDDRIANFRYYDGSTYNSKVAIKRNGNIETAGSIKTAAPTTGTADPWKFGTKVNATVVLDTTRYLEVEVAGNFYKIAIVT